MALDYLAVLSWLALSLALGAAALPLAAVVFRRLPDRGAGLALPAGLAVLAGVGYWVGQFRFGPIAGLAGIAVLAGASAVALARGVRPNWRPYVGVAVVFSLAFLFMLQLRSVDPGAVPGGGEKFLDFGLLASLLRSEVLPPEDPWFAGRAVSYYYGGHMLAALQAELLGTPARFAYNYALAAFYAAFVATAYGLAGTIAAGSGRSYVGAGALAAFFVGIASNLAPAIRLSSWALPWTGGERLLEAFGLESEGLAGGPEAFNYWFASRVIDGGMTSDGPWQLINEFPFFAWLNGDLHGHMMSPVFLLLVVGLGYAYYRTPASAPARERAVPLLAAGPVVGLVAIVNTWSAPAAVGLVALAVLFAPAPPWTLLPTGVRDRVPPALRQPGPAHEVGRLASTGIAVAAVGAVAAWTIYPFISGPLAASGAASSRSIGFLPTPRADLPGLLVVFGAFLAIYVAYLLATSPAVARAARNRWVLGGLGVLFAVTWLYRATAVFLFVPPLAASWWALRRNAEDESVPAGAGERRAAGRASGAGGGPAGTAGPDAASVGGDPASGDGPGYPGVVLIGICGLLVIIEFAYVVEQAGPGRYNTAFKVYSQAWALWAVVGAVALPAVADVGQLIEDLAADCRALLARVRAVRERPAGSPLGPRSDGGSRLSISRAIDRSRLANPNTLAVALAAVLLVSMSIYTGFGVAYQHENGREEPTLDARAFVAEQHPEEHVAIEWLNDLEGQPNMASAPGRSIYTWVNGPSSLTGIPTVAGWAHEIGYRGNEAYLSRAEDVRLLFTSGPERRAELLRQYRVEYIYYGPIEKKRYGMGLAFDSEPGISVAHQSGDVTIYRVDQSALSAE